MLPPAERITASNWSTAERARSLNSGCVRLPRGWGTSAQRTDSSLHSVRVASSTDRKRSVAISMAGIPRRSTVIWLSRPLDEQLPQSPWVRNTASQRSTAPHSFDRITLAGLYEPRTTSPMA